MKRRSEGRVNEWVLWCEVVRGWVASGARGGAWRRQGEAGAGERSAEGEMGMMRVSVGARCSLVELGVRARRCSVLGSVKRAVYPL